MVCGSGLNGVGMVLLFRSDNLLDWQYEGVLYSDTDCRVLECPDFFPLGDKYVLMFSKIGVTDYAVNFVIGDFDGKSLSVTAVCAPEAGPQFYAPQTFEDKDGRRIMIGWMYDWHKKPQDGAKYAGALSAARELSLDGDCNILNFPVSEAHFLLADSDPAVEIQDGCVRIDKKIILRPENGVREIAVLRDTKTIEVFINGGRYSATYWLV